jgi:DNA adenine methylase
LYLLRYPGSKGKVHNAIIDKIVNYLDRVGYDVTFAEPFIGGGSITTWLLERRHQLKNVWINDYDIGMASLWTAVLRDPEFLYRRIDEFEPSVKAFFEYKEALLIAPRVIDYEIGFKKLAIHQISFSGLGTKAGGPLGGQEQESEYGVDCRWKPLNLKARIKKANALFAKCNVHENSCTYRDFEELIEAPGKVMVYLDPPYYEKGPALYQHHFELRDHARLAKVLQSTDKAWLLSYDDAPYIRKLYDWAEISELKLAYTINTSNETESREKTELLITSKECSKMFENPNEPVDLFA